MSNQILSVSVVNGFMCSVYTTTECNARTMSEAKLRVDAVTMATPMSTRKDRGDPKMKFTLGRGLETKVVWRKVRLTHFVANGGSGKSAMADGKVVRRQQAKS